MSRKEVNAAVWLNNGLPAKLCNEQPELQDYGFYRRLNNGQLEFIPFCDLERSKRMIAFWDEDFNKILDALLPENKTNAKGKTVDASVEIKGPKRSQVQILDSLPQVNIVAP